MLNIDHSGVLRRVETGGGGGFTSDPGRRATLEDFTVYNLSDIKTSKTRIDHTKTSDTVKNLISTPSININVPTHESNGIGLA